MIGKLIRKFFQDRGGHSAIEYSVIIGVGAIAIVTSLNIMGAATLHSFTDVLAGFAGG
ncbi:MAG: Flp family type IVb pilin [Hyphomonadaceae bacterium]